jgi:hypothetical protein
MSRRNAIPRIALGQVAECCGVLDYGVILVLLWCCCIVVVVVVKGDGSDNLRNWGTSSAPHLDTRYLRGTRVDSLKKLNSNKHDSPQP